MSAGALFKVSTKASLVDGSDQGGRYRIIRGHGHSRVVRTEQAWTRWWPCRSTRSRTLSNDPTIEEVNGDELAITEAMREEPAKAAELLDFELLHCGQRGRDQSSRSIRRR